MTPHIVLIADQAGRRGGQARTGADFLDLFAQGLFNALAELVKILVVPLVLPLLGLILNIAQIQPALVDRLQRLAVKFA